MNISLQYIEKSNAPHVNVTVDHLYYIIHYIITLTPSIQVHYSISIVITITIIYSFIFITWFDSVGTLLQKYYFNVHVHRTSKCLNSVAAADSISSDHILSHQKMLALFTSYRIAHNMITSSGFSWLWFALLLQLHGIHGEYRILA